MVLQPGQMNLISRLFASSAIQIRDGKARCVKGNLMSRLLNDISSLAAESGIQQGEIWLDPLGKVSFSREIPEEIHQRIRNVISSH